MTPEALRRLALSLPETSESPHFERTSFRVGKKIFATMKPDGSEAMVRLADPADAEDWIASRPALFFGYGTWTTRNGALGVRLERAPAALMRALVIGAWKSLATQRALAAFEGERPRKPARGKGGPRRSRGS